MVKWAVPALLALGLVAGCEADPCPRGSMLDSQGGLLVTEEEHPTGWGLEDCEECHAIFQLHRLGCTEEVDLEVVREVTEEEGLDACAACHGDNGVVP